MTRIAGIGKADSTRLGYCKIPFFPRLCSGQTITLPPFACIATNASARYVMGFFTVQKVREWTKPEHQPPCIFL